MTEELIEGEDFVIENGLMVLTAKYLLKRGHCCENNCRNCPYKEKPGDTHKTAKAELDKLLGPTK